MHTGPACWEKAANLVKVYKNKKYVKVVMTKAIPISTHIAMVGLMVNDYMKYIIRQNTEGQEYLEIESQRFTETLIKKYVLNATENF